MTEQQAKEIADLLNGRNELSVEYTPQDVLRDAANYIFEVLDGTVIASIEVKAVQWYQWEICHLSVSEHHEGQGFGKLLIRRAEEKARNGNARIVQCTIRVGNEASERAFRRRGYRETCSFFNGRTHNYVAVWQKVLAYRT